MKKPILLTLLCTFLLVLNGVAQNTNIQSIINKAGAQRAISQRMAKDYMLIGLGIRVEESLKDLDESSSVFNENLHEIIFYNKSKKTEDAVAKVNELYDTLELHEPHKKILQKRKFIIQKNYICNYEKFLVIIFNSNFNAFGFTVWRYIRM